MPDTEKERVPFTKCWLLHAARGEVSGGLEKLGRSPVTFWALPRSLFFII